MADSFAYFIWFCRYSYVDEIGVPEMDEEHRWEVDMSEHKFDHKKQEQINEQKSLNKFNSVTQKDKPENQNQQHNVREEGIGPVNQKR